MVIKYRYVGNQKKAIAYKILVSENDRNIPRYHANPPPRNDANAARGWRLAAGRVAPHITTIRRRGLSQLPRGEGGRALGDQKNLLIERTDWTLRHVAKAGRMGGGMIRGVPEGENTSCGAKDPDLLADWAPSSKKGRGTPQPQERLWRQRYFLGTQWRRMGQWDWGRWRTKSVRREMVNTWHCVSHISG